MAVIDASVFVSFFNPHDEHHQKSRKLIMEFIESGEPIRCPSLLLFEVIGAIRRRTGSELIATGVLVNLLAFRIEFIDLDLEFSSKTAEICARLGMKGSDAAYVSAAKYLDDKLYTFDKEQRKLAKQEVEVW